MRGFQRGSQLSMLEMKAGKPIESFHVRAS
jgi:hypothetical protein